MPHMNSLEDVRPVDASTLVDAALAHARGEGKDRSGWLTTGLEDIDSRCGGLAPGALIVIGSRPGMGKAALGRTIAAHLIVSDSPSGVLMHVPAEGTHSIVLDFLASIANVSRSRLRAGTLDVKDEPNVSAAAEQLRQAGNLLFADAHEYSVASLRKQAMDMRERGASLRLIIVERVDQMLVAEDHHEREREMAGVVRELKQLALDLHLPVIALLSVNPDADERMPPRPRIHDFTAAASVERHADMVVFVYRPDYYLQEETPVEWQGKAEVIISSFKQGQPGSTILGYLAPYGKFVNLKPSRRSTARQDRG